VKKLVIFTCTFLFVFLLLLLFYYFFIYLKITNGTLGNLLSKSVLDDPANQLKFMEYPILSLTHTHSLIHSHSLTHSLTLTRSFTHSFTHCSETRIPNNGRLKHSDVIANHGKTLIAKYDRSASSLVMVVFHTRHWEPCVA
jgi:hypothetical protein